MQSSSVDMAHPIEKWANGNTEVSVYAVMRIVGLSFNKIKVLRDSGPQPWFPIPTHVSGARLMVLVSDLVKFSPKEWAVFFEKAEPITKRTLSRSISYINTRMPDIEAGRVTMAEIGSILGITRERVRQIFRDHYSISGKQIIAARKIEREKAKLAVKADKDKHAELLQNQIYGVPKKELVSLYGDQWHDSFIKFSSVRRYVRWKHGRAAWNLSFVDWMTLLKSINEKSLPSKSYLRIRRIDKSAPYSLGNVVITNHSKMLKELRANEKMIGDTNE